MSSFLFLFIKSAGRSWLTFSLACTLCCGQLLLNPNPTRVIGQTSLTISSGAPNLVEGRELYFPQAIALDTSTNPPAIYVSDTLNNRVLGFKNASAFTNGQKADIVVGQPDFKTTLAQGPGRTTRTTGFTSPTGLAVDANGTLYVADSGNNRVLRFTRPFAQSGDILPDLVIGQKAFNTNGANQGAASGSATAATLSFVTSTGTLESFPSFDSSGNLWIPDAGNNRLLRYPASALGAQAVNGPNADIVLAQTDFLTTTFSPPSGTSSITSLRNISNPTAVAFDSGGRLFVTESRSGVRARILVYSSPFSIGKSATRLLGVDLDNPQPPTTSEFQLAGNAGALFAVGDQIGVADTANNRLLLFPPFDSWSSNQLYQPASVVIGQPDFSSADANRKLPDAGPDRLRNPADAVFFNNELYVADAANNRVIVMPRNGSGFDPATRVLGQDALGLSTANLIEGREFAFSASGSADAGMVTDFKSSPPHLYVSDTHNNRILCYRDLRNLRPGDKADFVIGQPDMQHSLINYPDNDSNLTTASGLSSPTGLALDGNGNLYVADSGNGRVLRFPKPFDNFAAGVMPKADLVLGQISFTSKITDPSTRTMSAPYGVAFASSQGLLVSDVVHNRVLFFPGSPNTLQSGQPASIVFGQPDFYSSGTGSSDNQMNAPQHIATDTDDRLYIADTGNSRLLIFDHAPTAVASPHAALALPGFTTPRGLFVNAVTGEVWIADATTAAVTRYPKYNDIGAQGFTSNTKLTEAAAPLAVTQDVYGNVYVADSANRIVVHYPGVAALNAANYLYSSISPGMIAAIFASNIGTKQFGGSPSQFTSLPLPKALNGLQVTINDVLCPLFYADDSQINIQVPWSTPASGTGSLAITELSTGRVVGSATVALNPVSPGLFTANGAGTGPAAAINSDGTKNSAQNPAAQGSYITLYGTGQGIVSGTLPKDGDVNNTPQNTARAPTVIINTGPIPDGDVQYSGLAPTLVGVWQVNARIPDNAPPSTNAAPVQVVVILDSTPSGGGGLGRPVTLYIKQKQ